MNKKQVIQLFLKYPYLDDEMIYYHSKIAEINNALYGIKSTSYDRISVQSTKDHDDSIITLIDKKALYERKLLLCSLHIADINNSLKLLNEVEKAIVKYRYFEDMTDGQIMRKIGYSRRQYYRYKRESIDKVVSYFT